MPERRGGDERRERASAARPTKPSSPATPSSLVSARLHARNRRLGVFIALLGVGALYLNFHTYVASIRAGELGSFGYPVLALWAAVALGVVLLGVRIIMTGEDTIPD